MSASLQNFHAEVLSGTSRDFTLSVAPTAGNCLIAMTVLRFTSNLNAWSSGLTQSGVTWEKLDETSNGTISHALWIAVPSNVTGTPSTTLNISGSTSTAVELLVFEVTGALDETSANIVSGTLKSDTSTSASTPRYVPFDMSPGFGGSPDSYVCAHDDVLGLGVYAWIEDSGDTYSGTPNDGFSIIGDETTGTADFLVVAKQLDNADDVQPYIEITDNRRVGVVFGIRSAEVAAAAPLDPPLATETTPTTWTLTEKSAAEHGLEAVDRLLRQFLAGNAGPKLQGLVQSIGETLGEIETVLFDIHEIRHPDNATSTQLDRLGRLVGVQRLGRDDTDYRVAIKAQIAANVSAGTIPELLNILTLVSGTSTVKALSSEGRSYELQAIGATITQEMANAVGQAHPAGVRGAVRYVPDLDNALILGDTDVSVLPTGATSANTLADDEVTDTGGDLAGVLNT